MTKYPEFKAQFVNTTENKVVGSLNRLNQGEENWVGENFMGALLFRKAILFGRWHWQSELWNFKFENETYKNLHLQPEQKMYAIDGYWAKRIEIVFSDNFHWHKLRFIKSSHTDHTHCGLCWSSISEQENTEYFFNGENAVVCEACYINHVFTKDISFVPCA